MIFYVKNKIFFCSQRLFFTLSANTEAETGKKKTGTMLRNDSAVIPQTVKSKIPEECGLHTGQADLPNCEQRIRQCRKTPQDVFPGPTPALLPQSPRNPAHGNVRVFCGIIYGNTHFLTFSPLHNRLCKRIYNTKNICQDSFFIFQKYFPDVTENSAAFCRHCCICNHGR